MISLASRLAVRLLAPCIALTGLLMANGEASARQPHLNTFQGKWEASVRNGFDVGLFKLEVDSNGDFQMDLYMNGQFKARVGGGFYDPIGGRLVYLRGLRGTHPVIQINVNTMLIDGEVFRYKGS